MPDTVPSREESPEFIKDKAFFLEGLKPALERNADIDPKSHCDLEIMRVELRLPTDCVINVKSRPFYAHSQGAEVAKQIKRWWDDGVIVKEMLIS